MDMFSLIPSNLSPGQLLQQSTTERGKKNQNPAFLKQLVIRLQGLKAEKRENILYTLGMKQRCIITSERMS